MSRFACNTSLLMLPLKEFYQLLIFTGKCYFMEVLLSSQKETGQNVQSCCSNILSLWVLLLDSAVGRLVFCRGVTEAACCQMKSVKMQNVTGKKQHQGNWGALRYSLQWTEDSNLAEPSLILFLVFHP